MKVMPLVVHGAAELKVCHRGEAPVAGLKSPIAAQSPRQEGPAQEQRRAGEGQRCPLVTHIMLPGQIWFRSRTCVTVAQSSGARMAAIRLLIYVLQK